MPKKTDIKLQIVVILVLLSAIFTAYFVFFKPEEKIPVWFFTLILTAMFAKVFTNIFLSDDNKRLEQENKDFQELNRVLEQKYNTAFFQLDHLKKQIKQKAHEPRNTETPTGE